MKKKIYQPPFQRLKVDLRFQSSAVSVSASFSASLHHISNASLHLFIFIAHFSISYSGEEVKSLESVPDLEQSMYVNANGYPCVRLLSLTGEIGCANPGREKVVAPVVRLKDVGELAQPSTILITEDEMQNFFNSVSKDQNLAEKVAGVLIESSTEFPREEGDRFSPDEKFPQAKFAPYKNIDYEWNPPGSNILWKKYNFPVFLLSQDSTLVLRESQALLHTTVENSDVFHLITTTSGHWPLLSTAILGLWC